MHHMAKSVTVVVHDRAPGHGTPVIGRLCSATMISCFDVP
jgi:hypothetical protein